MKCLEAIDKFLRENFRKLGYTIANYTGYFFIIPVMLAIICGTGFQRMHYETDPEYLFSPTNGLAKQERNFVESHFKMNFSSNFDPSRITRPGRFVRLIITAKDKGTIIRTNVWDEISKLDKQVRNVTIIYDEELYTYQNVCAKWEGKCYGNDILNLRVILPEVLNGSISLTYPFTVDPERIEVHSISVYFGGMTVKKDGRVTNVKAVILSYWLKSNSTHDDLRSKLWEKKIITNKIGNDYKLINVARYTSKTLEDELDVNTTSVIPYLVVTVFLMIVFSILTLCMTDWVRSKAYMGFLGIFSVILASIMTFGIMMYANVPFIGMNLAAPFLMLGIGVDDMFVMLGAWRRTRIQDTVEERLGETYAEAGVAITITSLTDMFSFFIGIITPFPSVQIFCLYTGTAVLMTYLWQLTFFGACMAVAGRMEAKQKHAICCHTVKSKSESEENFCYSIWCAGGVNPVDPWNPDDNKPHAMMIFFRDVFAKCLNKSYVKGLIILLFMLYLSGAIYGLLEVKEGLERRRLSRYDSYSVKFYDLEDKYFREFPYRIQVVLHGDINYSDPKTKELLLSLHNKLENLNYVAPDFYTDSWIRGWYAFLDTNEAYLPFNITDEAQFVKYLREYYLSGDDNLYKMDVTFDENNTRIIASRFIIQAYKIRDSNADKELMKNLRNFAEEFPLNITVYHPLFIFFDQYVLVRSSSIKTIGIAAGVMLLVSLFLIPNPWCSLWVGFSILSIEVGVVGYMTLWGVNLDSISMINLIMCIGFSVDFSAHISYAYFAADAVTPEDRVKDSLYTLGFPILQGAISTVLGVAALVLAPSYIFLTFCKTVFLVVFFGAMHGLLLLPVLLSILGPGSCERQIFSYGQDPYNRNEIVGTSRYTRRKTPSDSSVENNPQNGISSVDNQIDGVIAEEISSITIKSLPNSNFDKLTDQNSKGISKSHERQQAYSNYGFEADDLVKQKR